MLRFLTCNVNDVTILKTEAKRRKSMEKTATLNLRITPELKSDAESILTRLGIPMSTAVDMFLNQVVLTGGIPFPVTLANPMSTVDISQMTEAQLHAKLKRGYESYKQGKVYNAEEAFDSFRERHK